MDADALKQQILTASTEWLDAKLDAVVEANPRMAALSTYIRRGLKRKLADVVQQVDGFIPFIADESGEIDITDASSVLLNAFDEMPVQTQSFMGMTVKAGKGSITLSVPRNIFTDLFLDNGNITLSRADFEELVGQISNLNVNGKVRKNLS